MVRGFYLTVITIGTVRNVNRKGYDYPFLMKLTFYLERYLISKSDNVKRYFYP